MRSSIYFFPSNRATKSALKIPSLQWPFVLQEEALFNSFTMSIYQKHERRTAIFLFLPKVAIPRRKTDFLAEYRKWTSLFMDVLVDIFYSIE